jgi:4'-phosphopantetheinyl transferase superfamily
MAFIFLYGRGARKFPLQGQHTATITHSKRFPTLNAHAHAMLIHGVVLGSRLKQTWCSVAWIGVHLHCWLAGLVDPLERAEYFVRLWTLKEAYVKAAGRGIAQPPGFSGFSVALSSSGRGQSAEACMATTQSTPHADGDWSASGRQALTPESLPHVPWRIDFQPPLQELGQWHLELFDIGGHHTAALCMQVTAPGWRVLFVGFCWFRRNSLESGLAEDKVGKIHANL